MTLADGTTTAPRLIRTLFLGLIAVALLALAGIAAIVLWRWRSPPERETIDRFAVVEAMRQVLKLATIETQVAEVVTYHDVKPVLHFFSSEKNAILRIRGKALAGFDLTDQRLDIAIDETARRIRLRLPHARILALDPSVEILDEESGWQNAVTVEDRNLWLKWARGDLRRAALDAGIIAEAEAHARQLAESFAKAYGFRAEVVFDGPSEPAAAPDVTTGKG